MRILVTGGSGRLGNVLVRKLLAMGHDVHVMVEPGDTSPESLADVDVKLHAGSVLDKPSLSSAMKHTEVVYHLAAKVLLEPDKDGSMWAVNVTGTRYVADLCLDHGVSRLVHCSVPYALEREPMDQVMDETRPLALNEKTDYFRSKAHSERYILDYINQGLDSVILSPVALIGPYDFGPSIMGQFLLEIYSGRMNTVVEGKGSFVDVRDAVEGIVAAAEIGKTGERYFLAGHMLDTNALELLYTEFRKRNALKRTLCSGTMSPMLQIIKSSKKVRGRELSFNKEIIRATQAPFAISNQKAISELGFRIRDIKSSFLDTLGWYEKMNWLS